MNIERALNIEGWMSEPELIWLAEQASRHAVIVELGSHLGRSTCAIAENTEGVVFAIDTWAGYDELPMFQFEIDSLLPRFKNNLKDYIANGRCVPIIADHAAAPPVQRAEMVFIDGSHTYENARRDIIQWLPHCSGLICGHDYDLEDVQRAVADTLGNVDVVPGTNIWWKNVVQ